MQDATNTGVRESGIDVRLCDVGAAIQVGAGAEPLGRTAARALWGRPLSAACCNQLKAG